MDKTNKEKYTFNEDKLSLITSKDKRYTQESLIKKLKKSQFVKLKDTNEWTIPENINITKATLNLVGLLVCYGVL